MILWGTTIMDNPHVFQFQWTGYGKYEFLTTSQLSQLLGKKHDSWKSIYLVLEKPVMRKILTAGLLQMKHENMNMNMTQYQEACEKKRINKTTVQSNIESTLCLKHPM